MQPARSTESTSRELRHIGGRWNVGCGYVRNHNPRCTDMGVDKHVDNICGELTEVLGISANLTTNPPPDSKTLCVQARLGWGDRRCRLTAWTCQRTRAGSLGARPRDGWACRDITRLDGQGYPARSLTFRQSTATRRTDERLCGWEVGDTKRSRPGPARRTAYGPAHPPETDPCGNLVSVLARGLMDSRQPSGR